ncbi:hypothetical protein TWF694_004079 [Orbilia ellipsospora]|uniref:Uncharacterized protein n=1 Tax=Orbilia ellipsospora TaxID=2528407 RepID=A0AAV9WY22_9PEZI
MATDKEKKEAGRSGCVYLAIPVEPSEDIGIVRTSPEPHKHHMQLHSRYNPEDDRNKGTDAKELTKRLSGMEQDQKDDDWVMIDSPPPIITMKPSAPCIKKRRTTVTLTQRGGEITNNQDLRQSTILPPKTRNLSSTDSGRLIATPGIGHQTLTHAGTCGLHPESILLRSWNPLDGTHTHPEATTQESPTVRTSKTPGLDARRESLRTNLQQLKHLTDECEENLNVKRKR